MKSGRLILSKFSLIFFAFIFLFEKIIVDLSITFLSSLTFPGHIYSFNAEIAESSNNGILLVVSFHSLEDRIVKYFFNFYSNLKGNPSRYLPSENNSTALFKVLSKRSKIPEASEIKNNIRSRSAKLRYAIRNESLFFYPEELEKKFINYLKVENIKI